MLAHSPLTAKETQVLTLLARGQAQQDVGARLGISVRTVKGHVAHIHAALNALNTPHAIYIATSRGYIEKEAA